MTAALATLNPAALVTLADCEQRIERGLRSFRDIGQALAEIRDSRLYKGTHATFEDYCEQRWNLSRRHSYQLIESAEAVCSIEHTGLPAPERESQARELAKVPEAERADVWRDVVESGDRPTAAAIRKAHEARTQTPGPTGAALSPPADPGTSPAPAVESPVPAAPQEPDPELVEHVFRVLAGASELGMTVPEIWCKAPAGVRSGAVRAAVVALADAGRVLVASTTKHGARWVVTPEPDGVDLSAAQPSGSGQTAAPVPGEGGAGAAPPATWTPEQHEEHRLSVQRKQAVDAAHRFAGALVLEVRGMVTTIIDGIDFGAPASLVTAEMIAECRAALDRLEARVTA